MSFESMQIVWGMTGLTMAQKIILLNIADRVKDDKPCWPSAKRIALDCSIGDIKTVYRALAELEKKGCIKTIKVPGKSSRYFLNTTYGETTLGETTTSVETTPPTYGETTLTPMVKPPHEPIRNQEDEPVRLLSASDEPKRDPPSTPQKMKKAVSREDDCPYQEIIELYHEHLPGSPKVKKGMFSETRKKKVKARWNGEVVERLKAQGKGTTKAERIQFMAECFKQAAASDTLTGKRTFKDGGVFFASLDFLMTQEKFIRLIEGWYDNRRAS